jgi:hypothetical protein
MVDETARKEYQALLALQLNVRRSPPLPTRGGVLHQPSALKHRASNGAKIASGARRFNVWDRRTRVVVS